MRGRRSHVHTKQAGNGPVDSVSDLLNIHLGCSSATSFLSCGVRTLHGPPQQSESGVWLRGSTAFGPGGDVTPLADSVITSSKESR